MQTEIITPDTVSKYLGVLTGDEIYAISDDRYTCFGAFDNKSGHGLGILAAQVLPEYIKIERIFTLPEYRNQGIASALLDLATGIPNPPTFRIFIDSPVSDTVFLVNRGFAEEDSSYSFITGRLGDVVSVSRTGKLAGGLEVLPADKTDQRHLAQFVFSSGFDDFVQIPEGFLDMDRFSDGSTVCSHYGKVLSAVLLEELDDWLQITWMKGSDNRSMLSAFSALKRELDQEYVPGAAIRFLICDDKDRALISNLIRNSREEKIRIFKRG